MIQKSKTNASAYNKDTTVRTIEEKYGVKFDVPSDTKLWKLFELKGFSSLAQIIRKYQ